MQTLEKEYLTCADTAKLVRKALQSKFPGIKFSVRSKTYSGGASIDVSWDNGPRSEAVKKTIELYEGADFDGMTDLKSYKSSLLASPAGIREVHFGADYVFTNRNVTDFERLALEAETMINNRCIVKDGKFGNEWVQHLATSMARDIDFSKGETLSHAYDRVVLRKS